MPYTVQSSEKLRKSASDFETEAMLYLMNFREDSSQMHYFVVDFFNDVTGMDRMAGRLWDIQSKASKSATAKAIGRELVTLYKNYISDFDFSEYILFLGAVPDTFRIDSNLNFFQIDNVSEKSVRSVREGLIDECRKKAYIDKSRIENDSIVLRKQFVHKTFEERLAEFNGEITVCDFDWGEPVGREIL